MEQSTRRGPPRLGAGFKMHQITHVYCCYLLIVTGLQQLGDPVLRSSSQCPCLHLDPFASIQSLSFLLRGDSRVKQLTKLCYRCRRVQLLIFRLEIQCFDCACTKNDLRMLTTSDQSSKSKKLPNNFLLCFHCILAVTAFFIGHSTNKKHPYLMRYSRLHYSLIA